MEKIDIFPPTNTLYRTNIDHLSKSLFIISDKYYPSSYPITYTSILTHNTFYIGHYLNTDYVMSSAPAHDIQPASPGISVTIPYGNKNISSHTSNLNVPGLISAASQCHIFPEFSSGSLLSIVVICDHDFNAHFHKKSVKISLNGVTIITVPQNSNVLWTIPHPQVPNQPLLMPTQSLPRTPRKFLTAFPSNTPPYFLPLFMCGVVTSMQVTLPLGRT